MATQVMDPQMDDDPSGFATFTGSPLSASNKPQTGPALAQSQLQDDRSMELQRAQGLQGIINQRSRQYQDSANDVKQILTEAANTLRNTPVGPSKGEQWQRMVAGYVGSPVGAGNQDARMAGAVADSMQQRREAELAKQQLIAQYGLQGGQYGLQAAQMGLNNLNSQENNAQSRLTSLDSAIARTNNPNSLVINTPNGPQANQPMIDAKASLQRAIMQNSASLLTPDAKELAYQQFLTTGQMPQGFGRSPAMVANLSNYIAQRAASEGHTAQAVNAAGQATKAAGAVLKDYTSGKTNQQIVAINTAVNHANALTAPQPDGGPSLIDALETGDIKVLNKAKLWWEHQTGSPAPTNYAAVAGMVEGEVAKAALPGGGTKDEREALHAPLAADNGKDAIKGAIDQYRTILAGKTDALKQSWDNGTLGRQGDFHQRFLLPATRKALGIQADESSAGGNQPTDKDIAYLKAHPETAPKFKAHFGSLPEGISG